MNASVPPDSASPAERKLEEHLELVRRDRPEGGTQLTRRVVRTARWQRAARTPLQAVGRIAAALVDGLALALGGRRGRS